MAVMLRLILENESILTVSYCEQSERCDKGKIAARRLSQDDIDAVCTLYPPDGIGELTKRPP